MQIILDNMDMRMEAYANLMQAVVAGVHNFVAYMKQHFRPDCTDEGLSDWYWVSVCRDVM